MERCLGCQEGRDPWALDLWCHACLEKLREKLASQLENKQWGTAFGPSLERLFKSDKRWWDRHR